MEFESTFNSLLIYGTTFITSLMCVSISKNKPFRVLFSILAICIPAITATFRECGIDYDGYKNMYYSIQAGRGYGEIELLWYYLNKMLPSFEWVLFISATIFLGMSYYAICRFLKRDRCLAWFIILMVCYSTFYNGMRQMIAVSFVFAAISSIIAKKKKLGIVFIIVAYFFHKSALFMLILPVYFYFTKNIKHIEWVIIFLVVFSVAGLPIIISLIQYTGLYLGYLDKIEWDLALSFLLYSVPPLIPFYCYRKCFDNNILITCFNLYLLIIPCQFLGMSMAYVDRLMLYFQIFIAILVPLIIKELKNKTQGKNNLTMCYIIWFIIHYVVLNIILDGNEVFPYR